MKKPSTDLRNEVDENYQFGEIKLWYDSDHRQTDAVAVIVEAKANEVLFRKLLHKHCTFFAAQGWIKVTTLVAQALSRNMDCVIGIIDADFKRLTNYTSPPQVFLTDYHDTEMMLAHSEAWLHVLNQYADPKKCHSFEQKNTQSILQYLLELAKPIALLRYLKEKKDIKLVFRQQKKEVYEYLNYKSFVDTPTLQLNEAKLLKAVEDKSQLPNFFKNNPLYLEYLSTLKQQDIDLKEWCNGHDLMNLLSLALEKTIGNHAGSSKVLGEELEKALVIAYRFSDFETTNLYQTLQQWAEKRTYLSLIDN